jgi:hypothetical protein
MVAAAGCDAAEESCAIALELRRRARGLPAGLGLLSAADFGRLHPVLVIDDIHAWVGATWHFR